MDWINYLLQYFIVLKKYFLFYLIFPHIQRDKAKKFSTYGFVVLRTWSNRLNKLFSILVLISLSYSSLSKTSQNHGVSNTPGENR